MNRNLKKLARLCGVSLCYRNMDEELVFAKPKTVTKLVEAILEKDLSTAKEIALTLKEIEIEKTKEILSPVIVAWDGKIKSVFATLRKDELPQPVLISYSPAPSLDSSLRWYDSAQSFASKKTTKRIFIRRKETFGRVRLRLDLNLPFGYHSLSIKAGGRQQSVMVISAPSRITKTRQKSRSIGLFTPLYALRSKENSGIGDLNDLKRLMTWLAKVGGDFVSTLPLLAIDYAKSPFDPSPYSAISRLFLNEIYLPADTRKTTSHSEHVDYKTIYALKKETLLKQSKAFFSQGLDKKKDYLNFLDLVPEVANYARYRSRSKNEQQFHCYCQFMLHQKVSSLKKTKLFLDLPIGVDRESFDVTQYPRAFLKSASAGAPPDAMFRSGQNWGFYPSHPIQAREEQYHYFRRVLERHFAYAGMLRVDHMAGMHRIFTIPDAIKSREGAYLRYRSDELYAILLLEAHQKKALIVGEDLGVVPEAVHEKMKKHGISGMWVFEYMISLAPKKALSAISTTQLRLVSTHDTPPLFGFSQGLDIELLKERGFISKKDEDKHIKQRKRQLQKWMRYLLKRHQHQFVDDAFLTALLKKLCAPKGSLTQINIEDLWLESDPQNVPGTSNEYPNWSKSHRYTMEEWMKSEFITQLLRSLAHEK